jgi:hypothetical protein
VALASRALLETEFVVRGWALKSVDSLRFDASSAARFCTDFGLFACVDLTWRHGVKRKQVCFLFLVNVGSVRQERNGFQWSFLTRGRLVAPPSHARDEWLIFKHCCMPLPKIAAKRR